MSTWGENLDRELCLELMLTAAEGLRYEDLPEEPIEPEFLNLVRGLIPAIEDAQQRRVITLRRIEGKTDLEIINQTGLSEAQVKQLDHAAMFNLMRQLPPAQI